MEEPHPHILILPFPAQGHIKPMLCLAQLLCHAGNICFTFLNTPHNHRRLNNHLSALSTRFRPNLHFDSISDGLPEDDPRTLLSFPDLCVSIKSTTKPLLQDLHVSLNRKAGTSRPPVTCIIADGIMSFSIHVASDFGIRVVIFRTLSACCLWAYLCVPKLVGEGELPFGDDDMDRKIGGVAGMEGFLRRRDLPAACRSKQLDNPQLEFFVNETFDMTRASSMILNTFDSLEAQVLSEIARVVPSIYTIGPLHALLKSHVADPLQSSSSNPSLWEEERSCMMWLDSQPSRSVVYVSFGSLVVLTRGQFMEFWHGLVNSGKPFLWVLRSDLVSSSHECCEGMDSIETHVEVGTTKRWCVVDWAPQEEVLAHPSVGGFLTHGGWNSTLEAMVAAVPLICWPQLGDQTVNSRWISQMWRTGLDIKDTCDRSTVEKMVRGLMEDQREEIMRSVDMVSGLARDSVSRGGSSNRSLEKLIEELTRL